MSSQELPQQILTRHCLTIFHAHWIATGPLNCDKHNYSKVGSGIAQCVSHGHYNAINCDLLLQNRIAGNAQYVAHGHWNAHSCDWFLQDTVATLCRGMIVSGHELYRLPGTQQAAISKIPPVTEKKHALYSSMLRFRERPPMDS